MFFVLNKIQQASYPAEGLQNPENPHNPMILILYRHLMKMAVCSVYSKKAFAEFWDEVEQKKIPPRNWTPEMKSFAQRKISEAPKAPFVLKITIIGWIFILLVTAFFGMLIYNSTKAPAPKSGEYVAMLEMPKAGDIYFGHYEAYKGKGTIAGAKIGFGWFKVTRVDGENYYLAKGKEMNQAHKPKEQLDHTAFEDESMPPLKLTEHTGYNLRFKSPDGLTEVYITDKK